MISRSSFMTSHQRTLPANFGMGFSLLGTLRERGHRPRQNALLLHIPVSELNPKNGLGPSEGSGQVLPCLTLANFYSLRLALSVEDKDAQMRTAILALAL